MNHNILFVAVKIIFLWFFFSFQGSRGEPGTQVSVQFLLVLVIFYEKKIIFILFRVHQVRKAIKYVNNSKNCYKYQNGNFDFRATKDQQANEDFLAAPVYQVLLEWMRFHVHVRC